MSNDLGTLFSKIILPALLTTLYIVVIAGVLSVLFGFILAVILILTADDGLRPNKIVNKILDVVINVVRSFPFIILMVSIIPLTRLIVGTSIGENAAIVPITIAASPFIARLFETSFRSVNPSLIEAAKSFGASDMQIVMKVIVKESVPALISNTTLAVVSILGSTAMAGAIGAGGLGAVALTYGYQNFNYLIMYSTVVVLIVVVQIIQAIGDFIYRKSQ